MDLKNRKVRTQLRRNIGRWLRNEGVPERRGDPLIPYKEIPRFKEIAFKVIQNLESRSLEDFRKLILPHIKRIREENGLRFSDNMLKKHKWSKVLLEHPDIKEAWDKLPKIKSRKYLIKKCEKEKTYPDLESLFYKNDSGTFEDGVDELQMLNEDEEEFISINFEINSPENFIGNGKEQTFSSSSNLFCQPRLCAFVKSDEIEDSADNILREWKERSLKLTGFQSFYSNFEVNHFF